MMCDRCGERKATVHWTHIVNGERQDLNVCAECASQQGLFPSQQSAMGDLLAALMSGTRNVRTATGVAACPQCGYTLERFQKTGMLGCPDCYTQFEPWIQPILRRMQGSLSHRGQSPQIAQNDPAQPTDNVEMLKQQLKMAIADEAYEEAARLRDQIKALDHSGAKA